MATKTFSAPLAIIQIDGVTVGKMKRVQITETLRRAKVTGIGRLNPEEIPPVEWSGSMSCSSYSINFNLLANKIKKGAFRNAPTVEAWANAHLLQENGLEITVLRKVKDGNIDPETGLVSVKYETFAKVTGAFVTKEGFDVQEGQLSGRVADFEYTDPILFNDVV